MDLEHTTQAIKAANAENTSATTAAGISEQILLRRIDLRVLPPITVIYVMAFLDRYIPTKISSS